MVSSFIALIGLAGVMSMVVWQLQATRLNQSNTEAMTLAQRFFEGMIAQDYETIVMVLELMVTLRLIGQQSKVIIVSL